MLLEKNKEAESEGEEKEEEEMMVLVQEGEEETNTVDLAQHMERLAHAVETMTVAMQTQHTEQAKQNESFHKALDEHKAKEEMLKNKNVFQTEELHEALTDAGLNLKMFEDVYNVLSQLSSNISGDTAEKQKAKEAMKGLEVMCGRLTGSGLRNRKPQVPAHLLNTPGRFNPPYNSTQMDFTMSNMSNLTFNSDGEEDFDNSNNTTVMPAGQPGPTDRSVAAAKRKAQEENGGWGAWGNDLMDGLTGSVLRQPLGTEGSLHMKCGDPLIPRPVSQENEKTLIEGLEAPPNRTGYSHHW